LPGDEVGACTYGKDGKAHGHHSLIDYIISTPSLLFTSSGDLRVTASLSVADMSLVPVRCNGAHFDHLPIFLTVPIVALEKTSSSRNDS
jgi:hypothetical protein